MSANSEYDLSQPYEGKSVPTYSSGDTSDQSDELTRLRANLVSLQCCRDQHDECFAPQMCKCGCHKEKRSQDVQKLVDAARLFANPKNWTCVRCGRHDPANCFCGRYVGPLPLWDGEPYSTGSQPWEALAEALKPFIDKSE